MTTGSPAHHGTHWHTMAHSWHTKWHRMCRKTKAEWHIMAENGTHFDDRLRRPPTNAPLDRLPAAVLA